MSTRREHLECRQNPLLTPCSEGFTPWQAPSRRTPSPRHRANPRRGEGPGSAGASRHPGLDVVLRADRLRGESPVRRGLCRARRGVVSDPGPTARLEQEVGRWLTGAATGEHLAKIWGRAARTGSATWCWWARPGPERPRLAETLLAASGAIPRAGSVRDGTTVCDFEESEHAHNRTISLAVAPLVHEGVKVNLDRHPRVRRLRGRAARRAARRRLRAVRDRRERGGRRRHPRAVARVRRGRDAPGGRDHQARPGPGRLRGPAPPGAGRVRRPGDAALRPDPRGRRGHRPDRPARTRTRGRRDRDARRADRGGHRGVRGRDPHGPVRRRRGDRREGARRRPRARGRAGDVLPRRTRLLDDRRRLRRADHARRPRLPVALRAPLPRRVPRRRAPAPTRSPATPRGRWSPRS